MFKNLLLCCTQLVQKLEGSYGNKHKLQAPTTIAWSGGVSIAWKLLPIVISNGTIHTLTSFWPARLLSPDIVFSLFLILIHSIDLTSFLLSSSDYWVICVCYHGLPNIGCLPRALSYWSRCVNYLNAYILLLKLLINIQYNVTTFIIM